MPQTVYNLDPAIALPGQLGDPWYGRDITEFPASEVIPAGRFVEVNAGKVRLPQGTGAEISALAGVSIYVAAMSPGGYQIGDMVPVLRKGRVYVECDTAAAGAELADVRVKHSSTVATHRGKATSDATNAGAGVEVTSTTQAGKFRSATNSLTLALVDVNLP